MPRVGWLLLLIATAAASAVGAVPRPPVNAAVREAIELIPVDDPFPIRRVRGADTHLPGLLKELEPGPVVRLARADFESRVRAAGRAVAAGKNPARVIDATYSADFDAGELTGTAEIGILNAHGVTGFVPLDPLRLAVRSAKWSDGDAILAVPQGGATAVWVDRPGRRVLQLGWSLTGTTEPGERRFELRVPPCPTSILELRLPADQLPTASADVLLTGPFPAPGQPARRLWRLRFGGQAKVEFAVRATGAADSVAQAKLEAKYELSHGQLTAHFEYELHPARGSVGEWAFTADPGLRITDVVTNNRAGWAVDPPAEPGGPRRVRVSLRQPGAGGKVVITAVAPFPDASRMTDALPTIRPLNAVLDDEKLEVRIAPSLKVEAWHPGDYRLLDAAAPAAILPGGEPPRVLTLVGTLLPPGADELFRRMPSVRVALAEADFTTSERLEWHLGAARASLEARVTVRVRHGSLFQVVVRPPPGYVLDRGAAGPEELVSYVAPPAQGVQAVELARPLPGGQHAELRLEFRGPEVRAGEPLAFPAFAVVGAAERDGWLGITAAPHWSLAAHAGAGATRGGLWGWLTSDTPGAAALYRFRGKEPEGTATPAPARPAVSADAVVRVDAAGGAWTATTRFNLKVTGGEVSTLTAYTPGPPGKRTWKLLDDANAVTEAVPAPSEFLDILPLPWVRHALAAGAGIRAGGTVWVLRFARPLTVAAVIETTATGPAVSDDVVSLPLPRLLGANQTARAEAAPALKDRTEVTFDDEAVRVRTVPRGAPAAVPVSDAYLVTTVRGPDDVLAAFGGTVRGSRGAPLQVSLPPGAEVRGVCVAGRWLNPAACAERGEDGSLRVPLPAEPAVRFEVRYRLPVRRAWPTRPVESPAPVVPGDPPVKRWWAFASGVLPGWPSRPWEATADELPLLGGPLAGGEPVALVTRSDDELVRVGSARTADALAVALTAGWIVFGLIAFRRRSARSAVVLGAAVVVSLLVAELGPPWWSRVAWPPLIAATGVLAFVLMALALRSRGAAAPAAVAAALLAFAVLSLSALAQPPAAATVVIVADAEGKEEVVAPLAVMDRLDSLAHPPLPAAVITSAEYDLRAEETGARVVARFTVHAFREGENAVSIPLADARLERALVGGKPAFPSAPRPDTYVFALPGPGRHEVELHFAAGVTATGSERDLRFGVPEVPRARLTASLPGAARQPVVVGRFGRQAVATGERSLLEADAGAAKVIHIRWREGVGGAAVVKVREGCVWDVTEAGADLTAAYLVRVEQGTVAALRFDVPRELEVLRVAVRTLEMGTAPLPLRDWTLAPEKGGGRLLRVDFQGPTSGRLLVVLQCSPRKPITRQPVLRFPRVIFGNVTGETDAVYGLRISRLVVDNVGLTGVIDFPPDAFKDFAAVPDLKLAPDNPVRAFRPVPGGTAELRPALREGEPASTRTLTSWHVGPRRADATGTVSWGAKEPLPLLEFTLPGVKVLEVRGADVLAWNQSGSRVQVWLRGGVKDGAVEWAGTLVPVPAAKPVPDSLTFEPPHPQVLNARPAFEEIRVRPVDGWSVRIDRSRGWQAVKAAAGELRFRTESPAAEKLRVQLSH
jgi:hypothetical protein